MLDAKLSIVLLQKHHLFGSGVSKAILSNLRIYPRRRFFPLGDFSKALFPGGRGRRRSVRKGDGIAYKEGMGRVGEKWGDGI